MGVEKACSTEATRLYLEGNGEAATSSPSATITSALLAALPITAVLGGNLRPYVLKKWYCPISYGITVI